MMDETQKIRHCWKTILDCERQKKILEHAGELCIIILRRNGVELIQHHTQESCERQMSIGTSYLLSIVT
jgi:hypothetical protein